MRKSQENLLQPPHPSKRVKLAANLLQLTVTLAEILLLRKSAKLAIFVADRFCFSLNVRAIENNIECRKRNFSIPPRSELWTQSPCQQQMRKTNVGDFFFHLSLAESDIENDNERRKQKYSIPPLTRVMDPKSLSAVKLKKMRLAVSAI